MRFILTILVAWPLLLPSGLCVCRLAAAPRQPAEAVEVVKRRCGCCKRSASKPPSAPRPTLTGDRPVDDPHAPACPASPAWEVARASHHAPVDHDPCAPLAVTATWLSLADAPSVTDGLTQGHGPHPSPLSLFSCNFRC